MFIIWREEPSQQAGDLANSDGTSLVNVTAPKLELGERHRVEVGAQRNSPIGS